MIDFTKHVPLINQIFTENDKIKLLSQLPSMQKLLNKYSNSINLYFIRINLIGVIMQQIPEGFNRSHSRQYLTLGLDNTFSVTSLYEALNNILVDVISNNSSEKEIQTNPLIDILDQKMTRIYNQYIIQF